VLRDTGELDHGTDALTEAVCFLDDLDKSRYSPFWKALGRVTGANPADLVGCVLIVRDDGDPRGRLLVFGREKRLSSDAQAL
jgi:hypothetical protein